MIEDELTRVQQRPERIFQSLLLVARINHQLLQTYNLVELLQLDPYIQVHTLIQILMVTRKEIHNSSGIVQVVQQVQIKKP